MIAGPESLDYAVLAAVLLSLLAVGIWAGRRQATTDEFFLADRTLVWWPLGLSLAVAGTAAVHLGGAATEGYFVGLKLLLVPVLVWVAAPVVLSYVIPLYSTLELDSVFEYLELRFDPEVRVVAGVVYVVGMLVWLGGVLALPCGALGFGGGADLGVIAITVGAGAVVVAYTYLGGMKAAVWTDVVQVALMIVVSLVVLFAIANTLDKGLPQIWQSAEALGRTSVVAENPRPPEWTTAARQASVWAAGWSIWAAVPYLVLLPLFFFVADQVTLQRFFSARDDQDMIYSYLLGCGLFSLMMPVAMYLGMGLLAVYNSPATAGDELKPNWVVNFAEDPDTGKPLVDENVVLSADTVADLVARKALLDPHDNRPFSDPQTLLTPRGKLDVERLAVRAPRRWGGEVLLRRGSRELLGHFVSRHLPVGLVLAGLVAAAMATLDSALVGLATLVVVDFHRRFGWAEQWLARLCGKAPDDLDQADEMRLARPAVLVLGGAATVLALVLGALGVGLGFLFGVLNLFAGPLLGVFLLGLFTRRTTARAALGALIWGILVALWASLGHGLAAHPAFAPAWPFAGPLGPFWPLLFGLAATLVIGYLLSFAVGRRKTRDELSGLVVGVGRLGVLLDLEDQDQLDWIDSDDGQQGSPQGPWS